MRKLKKTGFDKKSTIIAQSGILLAESALD